MVSDVVVNALLYVVGDNMIMTLNCSKAEWCRERRWCGVVGGNCTEHHELSKTVHFIVELSFGDAK